MAGEVYDDVPDFRSSSTQHIPKRSSYERLVNFQQGLVSSLDEAVDAVAGSVKQAYSSGVTVGGVIQGDQQAIKDFNENACQTYLLVNQLMDPKVIAVASDAVKAQLMEASRAIAQGDEYAVGAALGAVLKDLESPKTPLKDLHKKAATVGRYPMETAATLLEGRTISDVDKHVAKLKNMRIEDKIAAANTPHPGAPTEDVINSLHSSAIMKQELEGAKARAAARETMGKWELLLTNVRENIGWGALVSRRDQDRLLLAGERGQDALMQTSGQIVAEKMFWTKVAAVPLGLVGAYSAFSDNPKSEAEQQAKAFVGAAGIAKEEAKHPELKDRFDAYHAVVAAAVQRHPSQNGLTDEAKSEIQQGSDAIVKRIRAGEPEPMNQSALPPREQLLAFIKTLPLGQQEAVAKQAILNIDGPSLA